MLGQTVVFERGKTYHMHLVNHLPEVTTFHWHGLEIPGPIEDGGRHAPVYPGEARDVTFKIIQPAATAWLHAHLPGNGLPGLAGTGDDGDHSRPRRS